MMKPLSLRYHSMMGWYKQKLSTFSLVWGRSGRYEAMLYCETSLKIQYETMFHFNLRLVATYFSDPFDYLLCFLELRYTVALGSNHVQA